MGKFGYYIATKCCYEKKNSVVTYILNLWLEKIDSGSLHWFLFFCAAKEDL